MELLVAVIGVVVTIWVAVVQTKKAQELAAQQVEETKKADAEKIRVQDEQIQILRQQLKVAEAHLAEFKATAPKKRDCKEPRVIAPAQGFTGEQCVISPYHLDTAPWDQPNIHPGRRFVYYAPRPFRIPISDQLVDEAKETRKMIRLERLTGHTPLPNGDVMTFNVLGLVDPTEDDKQCFPAVQVHLEY